jgi:hypothetical protein
LRGGTLAIGRHPSPVMGEHSPVHALLDALRVPPPAVARLIAALGLVGLMLPALVIAPPGFASRYSDAWTYLAAGERLNAGHPLYALTPGDREVMLNPVDPIPLLSPPPIAVVWRPLALLGEPAMVLWCVGALIASLALIGWGVAWGGWGSLVAVVVLGPPLLYAAMPGNANAYLAPLLALAWRARTRPAMPAIAVVAATAVKLTPVALAPWLLTVRRLAWAALAILVVVLVTEVAAPGAFRAWLATAGGAEASPTSVATSLGTDPRTTAIVIVGASWVLGIVLRRREALVFAIGLLAATLATPASYFHTFALLAPLIAMSGGRRSGRAQTDLQATPPAE